MRLGKPEPGDLASYTEYAVQDIAIYCHAAIAAMAGGADLTLEAERTFFSKKLVLYGIKMENHP